MHMNDKIRKIITAIQYFCACSPGINLILFLLLGYHIRLGLGHWPTPLFEDYSTFLFEAHLTVVDIMWLFAAVIAGPLWIVLAIVNYRKFRWKTLLVSIVCYLVSWGMVYVVWCADANDFVTWYFD